MSPGRAGPDRLSVVVPVYRVEPYVAACLESIAAQSRGVDEVVLVDDRGGDASIEIALEAAGRLDLPVVVHRMPRNCGPGAARNAGLAVSSGDLVWFCDADDVAEPWFVERLLDALRAHDAAFACCRAVRFAEGRGDDPVEDALGPGAISGRDYAVGMLDGRIRGYPTNKIFRREVVEAIGFPEGVAYEDLGTLLRIAVNARRVAVTPEPLYRYRLTPGSLSARFGAHTFDLLTQLGQVERAVVALGDPALGAALRRYRYREVVLPLANMALRDEHADGRRRQTREAVARARSLVRARDVAALAAGGAWPLARAAAVLRTSTSLYSTALRVR